MKDLEEYLVKTPGRYQKLMNRAFFAEYEEILEENFMEGFFEDLSDDYEELERKYAVKLGLEEFSADEIA